MDPPPSVAGPPNVGAAGLAPNKPTPVPPGAAVVAGTTDVPADGPGVTDRRAETEAADELDPIEDVAAVLDDWA